ncbi:glutamine--fructose-6-phosphate transaminase (isomerizing) [Myxococcus sp. CA051A]|uniref:Glutamine--fructose-6-phosphate aminotransferase [isomerizing] n=1 Tax=Myxococcus llanfairpwllgwyngyllgogerychwyrndrobwllllantysiliogogogochensis TaxID=2590453 RepID=A0A540WJ27_9BACT|nr:MULTISPECIES: glutamine--fructose-6-phosphate transaminase (isomerizing) [Myxococcus]NTX04973.1 glutamine--fructose-6-phosphate transaminase (isomerizing) [Myxococcus sp. CA040A]NTX15326.1 glutamine--fructose-6-phosphate transaminase (isomerizing) [Myxococcus sp. CA056]NTX37920.1 glutamine--fructose-6-phosphate transaminase (isomerizing) [Myxococcus sp. CA033]NTX56240.1 glutamine--fructose-6-phosphate transaminase (isomerizing) [Myxococcus sp. CA039A]NTX61569.1 glutamine--fructose-6-phospha
MCGIVGYVGDKESAPILVSGLKKLEYRGYDSAGVAVVNRNQLNVVRATGKLRNLENRVVADQPQGNIGIGHTRWATHGRPSDENAHPHTYKNVAVVHNGIIENHLSLKAQLRAKGHVFSSETDTEVFAHLISDELEAGKELPDAVRGAIDQVKGTYALAVVSATDPHRIVCTKNASPMVLGLSEGQNFIASDVPAVLEHTRDIVYMEEGDLAIVTAAKVDIFNRQGQPVNRATRRIDWTPMMAEKGGYKHFMHKEIWEQPRAVADTLRGRMLLTEGDVHFEGWNMTPEKVRSLTKITILACGTSWHSGVAGKHMIETLARLPVEVELASEFRYRDPIVESSHLAIAISQSGETADTLAAFKEAKARGATAMAICNVIGSAMTREAEFSVLTNAGPEIGVASTKAFTTQLVALYLLAVKLGRMRGTLSVAAAQEHLTHLTEIPKMIEEVLKCEPAVKRVAREFMNSQDFLFLGRGPMHPVALEGALKLKEISYIHAEGYAGGEMKHGPIALIDEKMPVVVIAPKKPHVAYEKIIGNIEEVRARGGKVIAVIDEDDDQVGGLADHVIRVPAACALLAPVIATIPLQLLAYHVAEMRGNDVDQPRNLAKSVTVE